MHERVREGARRFAPHLVVLGALSAISLVMTWRLLVSGHPTSSVLCQCGDPGQAVWFLEWVPWAVSHGHNPLLTNAMFAGIGGANLLQSTSYLLPSFVLAPVTWAFGPTASLNVALFASPVISGWCMFLAARRVASFFPGQLAAALLWGFSPFLVGAAQFGHLNFSLLFFPPLVFLGLHEIYAGSRSPVVVGVLLGLLVVVQFFSGTEPLAITVVAAGVGSVAALALAPRAAWANRRRILVGLGSAFGVAAVLLAYPLAYLLSGPRHVVGEPWPATSLYGAHVSDIVKPGVTTATGVSLSEVGGYYGPGGPGSSYLGGALLIGLAASVVVWWRRRVAWVLAIVGAFSWLCSLGAILLPLSGNSFQKWLPWRYLQHWPLLASVGPNRFAMIVDACAALLVAVSIDAWAELAKAAAGKLRPRSKVIAGAAVGGITALVAFGVAAAAGPLVATSAFPFRTHDATIPPYFTTTARHLPAGTVVLTYPYAASSAPDAMYWQAQEQMPFRLVGGRALVPGADGVHSEHVVPLTGLDPVLADDSFGPGIPTAPDPGTARLIRSSLRRWGVDLVVVVRRGRAPAWMAAVLTAALGEEPQLVHGAEVWANLSRLPPALRVAPAAVEHCAGDGDSVRSFLAAPACVLAAAQPKKTSATDRNRSGSSVFKVPTASAIGTRSMRGPWRATI